MATATIGRIGHRGLPAAERGNCLTMAQAQVTPARALARFMVAAFLAVVMTLVLTISAVGIAGPADAGGATTPATASASPTP